MNDIGIIDYGMANLRSVQKAFECVGAKAHIFSDPNRVADYKKIVLPGVGAFRDAIARLKSTSLSPAIIDHIHKGKKFLGICLGLQLLFERSFEEGTYPGMGVFPGDVVRFKPQPGLKIPHMGWNQISQATAAPMLVDLSNEASVYFVHSYYVQPKDHRIVATWTDYPEPFASSIWQDNVFASQFHPEKSQKVGLSILKRFVDW